MPSGDDQISRVRHALATGHEDKMDRLVDYRVVGELDQCAVSDERGVESGKRVLLELCDLSEVALYGRISRLDCARQTANAEACAHFLERRETFVENTIDENESVPVGLAKTESLEFGGLDSERIRNVTFAPRRLATLAAVLRVRFRHRQAERSLGDRRYAGEVPVFILGGGVAERLEPRDAMLAEPLQPVWSGLLALEIPAINLYRAWCASAGRPSAGFRGVSRHQLVGDSNLPGVFPCRDVAQAAPAPTPAGFCIQS